MAAKRRPVRPLLFLQATALVVLTVVVGMWTRQAMVTHQAEVRAPRRIIEDARAASRVAMTAPYLYLTTNDPEQYRAAEKGIDALEASLDALTHITALPPDKLSTASQAALLIEESIVLLYEADADADLSGALEDLARGSAVLDASLAAIERRVEASITDRFEETLSGLLFMWGGMLVVVLGTGMLAGRRARGNTETLERHVRQLDQELAGALSAAAEPASEDAPLPEVQAVPNANLDNLVAAARKAVEALGRLRETNARIQRSSSFTQDLMDALSMAETEPEVLATATRAARVAYTDAGYQLLLASDDAGRLTPLDAMPEPACRVESVDECPAIRKGRTLHNGVEEGIVRCPQLTDGAGCVTCSPVLLNGQAFAVSQLAGYDPEVTLLDDLEAHGLALGSRMGVVRSLAASEREAATDPLTRLPNRRMLRERIDALDRAEATYTVLVADIDHFKQINDEHGHDVGDQCLELFAQVLRDACRGTDVPCRYGGEEFVVLLPKAGMRTGLAVAMRIRYLLREAGRTAPVPFTVSMGVASQPDHGANGDAVMRAADAAMYDAKESGRDQVIPAHVDSDLPATV